LAGDYFEAIQITPGTLFMQQLHTALLWVGHKLLQRPGAPRLFLSLSSMPGEAEIKLFDPCLPHTPDGPALLATSDSDCILGTDLTSSYLQSVFCSSHCATYYCDSTS
jgi:hypothetical protein